MKGELQFSEQSRPYQHLFGSSHSPPSRRKGEVDDVSLATRSHDVVRQQYWSLRTAPAVSSFRCFDMLGNIPKL